MGRLHHIATNTSSSRGLCPTILVTCATGVFSTDLTVVPQRSWLLPISSKQPSHHSNMSDIVQNFKILSINVNGLNDARKRRLVFSALHKHKKAIILLQETHCRLGNSRLWKSQWGSPLFVNETSGNAGGVAILFSKDLEINIQRVTPSRHNRFLMAQFSIFGENYKIVNVYMPTSDREKDQIEVLEEMNASLDRDEGDIIFIGGDFNVALHDSLDRSGYASPGIPNKSFRSRLSVFLETHDLHDIWRTQNPTTRAFSWSRTEKLARLDYIFAPSTFPGQIRASQPMPCSFSDHYMIGLIIRPSIQPRGRGFWRLRTSLLNREDYFEEISEVIEKSKEDSVDLALRWEYIKLKIREASIKFSRKIQEEYSRLETELETRLLFLGKNLILSREAREEYQGVKRELFQIQSIRAREAMVRARVKWMGQGERPTKYFLNLEKKRFTAKTMTSVLDGEGTLLTSPDDILNFEKRHFATQYAANPTNIEAQEGGNDEIFLQPAIRIASDSDRMLLNRDLSVEELECSLRVMKNGKAPGCDGLPPEFYKKFWNSLGPLLLDSFLCSLEKGTLTPDQRRGVISLIPKKGRDKAHITNWRPISMLNTDFKILAKALARRLSNILPSVVHQNQTGFIPGRYIGDNIRNIQALLDFTQETGRSGLFVSLDFAAAFDSLDHSFLFKALDSFQLGETFLEWIKLLYHSSESCVLNCGSSSGWFPFSRGVRQGCPISPFLFVLAVEKLAEVIRGDPNIKGIDLLDTHTKILQFADDSSLFLQDEASLLRALQTLEHFKSVSGLGLNLAKSQGIIIGDVELQSGMATAIPWGPRFHILGINFDVRDYEDKEISLNFKPALQKMKKVCDSWSLRNISLKGKSVILNTLVLPIIYFQCSMLPVPQFIFREVDKMISSFLWCGKRPKISRTALEQQTADGGMGLHNFPNRVKAAKLSWLKKLVFPPSEPWHQYFEFKMDVPAVELALRRTKSNKLSRMSPFFAEIFRYWVELQKDPPSSEMAFRNESLWGNKFLKGKVKKKVELFCRDLNIQKINDLLCFGHFMSDSQFTEAYGRPPLPDMLSSLTRLIPDHWLRGLSPINTFIQVHSLYLKNAKNEWVELQSLPTRSIYILFQSKRSLKYTCADRWTRAYGGDEAFSSPVLWKAWSLLPYRLSHSIQLQSFSFRIMYRTIPCRVYLNQIKVVESEICLRCAERDDLFHFLFECQCIKEFWDNLATWLEGRQGVQPFPDDLTEEEFLLGVVERSEDFSLFNFILLCAKFYIYKMTTFNLGEPDLLQFILELKNRLSVERLCCFEDYSFNKRFKKWEVFFNDF